MSEQDGARDHEQVLLQLLDEMGRALARQEHLLEEIEGRHFRMRSAWVQDGAEEEFGEAEGQALVEELQRELEQRRFQELELHEILDVLRRRADLQDRLLAELESQLASEHRDGLFDELQSRVGRRDQLLDGVESRTFEEKRGALSETMELLRELEDRLFRVVERHLVRRHRERD